MDELLQMRRQLHLAMLTVRMRTIIVFVIIMNGFMILDSWCSVITRVMTISIAEQDPKW